MDGTAELLKLAHLLRVGATTARDIATVRRSQLVEIRQLAEQAEQMATDLEDLARAPARRDKHNNGAHLA